MQIRRVRLDMAEYTNERVIKEIPIGNSTTIRVKTYRRDGNQMLSIRKYVKSQRYTGYSKEGVDFTPQQAKQLLDALDLAITESA